MDDYYEDFGDDGDFFDDSEGNFEMDDPFDEDSGIEDAPRDNECDDDFTMEDAMMTSIAFGWGYEEGLEEGKRRKLEKKMNDKTDKKDDG